MPKPSVKAPLLAQAAALRVQADALAALANALPDDIEGAADLLDADQALAEFGVGRDGLKNAAARGELALSRGARGKILITRAELRRWLDSRPYKANPRKLELVEDDEGFDALDATIKAGRLRMTK